MKDIVAVIAGCRGTCNRCVLWSVRTEDGNCVIVEAMSSGTAVSAAMQHGFKPATDRADGVDITWDELVERCGDLIIGDRGATPPAA